MNKLLEKQMGVESCNFDMVRQELTKWQELLGRISDTYDAQESAQNELRTNSSSNKLDELEEQFLAAKKLTSMSEVSSSVLHNVGNIINSVNVSLGLITENLKIMHLKQIFSAIELMQQHKNEINYLIEDPRGKLLPGFLIALSDKIKEEQELFAKEIASLNTHNSSLNYLKQLPVDRLKIDQSFVQNIDLNRSDEVIIHAIIAMANSLNIQVVAEGVETKDQLNFLQNEKCFDMQGYLFSKPIEKGSMEKLLYEHGANNK